MVKIVRCFLFLLAAASLGIPVHSQSPDEYRTQIFKYLRDERINESLIMSVLARNDYPDNPFFQFIGNNPDPGELHLLAPTPDQARKDCGNLLEFADMLIDLKSDYSRAGFELYRKVASFNQENKNISYRLARHLFRSGEPQERKEALDLLSSLTELSDNEGKQEEFRKFKSLLDLITSGKSLPPPEFRSLYPEFSSDPSILSELARNSLAGNSCTDALAYLETSASIDPGKPETLNLQASAFSCLGNREQAQSARELYDGLSRNEAPFRSLKQTLLSGNRTEAIHGLELMLADSPGYLKGARLLARLYVEEGKKFEAAAIYKNYLQVFPDDLRVSGLAARLLLDEGLYDQAFAIAGDTSITETGQLIRAIMMIRGKNWVGAETILRKIIVDNPFDPMVLIPLSQSLSGQGKFSEARSFLQKGLKVTPGNPNIEAAIQDVEFDYARNLSEKGRRTESIAVFRKLVKLDPTNPQYLLNLGYDEMMNGEYGSSVNHLRQGLKLAPGEDWARSSLAYSLMNEWKYDDAVAEMKILISRSNDPDYLFQLGSIYNQIGNTRDGWALIRKAAKQGQAEAARLVEQRYGKD